MLGRTIFSSCRLSIGRGRVSDRCLRQNFSDLQRKHSFLRRSTHAFLLQFYWARRFYTDDVQHQKPQQQQSPPKSQQQQQKLQQNQEQTQKIQQNPPIQQQQLNKQQPSETERPKVTLGPFPEIPPKIERVKDPTKSDEPPERVKNLVDQMMELNLRELMAMTKLLQKRLGLSDVAFQNLLLGAGQIQAIPMGAAPLQAGATMSTAAGPQPQQQQAAAPQAAKEEQKAPERSGQQRFDIKLIKYPEGDKFKVLKEIRALKPGMPLMESKALVENLPQVIMKGVTAKEAEEWKNALSKVGAVIEIV
jgi:ribosomal protein L7/L12